MTILVVDDSATVRDVLKAVLQAQGHTIVEASDGDEALKIAAKQPIDLLLTDIVMPRMSGVELAKTLTAARPELPVLFISGFPFDLEEHKKHLPRCAFLQKPFNFDRLFKTIEELTKK
jgi:two-component system, cell cycle sensor histidine kinase and response regulator CckA